MSREANAVEAAPGDGVECRRKVYDPRNGLIICKDTGEVIGENVIEGGKEWRQYQDGVKGVQRSSGKPVAFSRPTRLVMDTRGVSRRDRARLRGSGRSIGGRRRLLYATHDRSDKAMNDMITWLRLVASELGLSTIALETAAILVKEYYKMRRAKGREAKKNTVFTAREKWAVVYVALSKARELHNITITEGEIEEALARVMLRYGFTDEKTALETIQSAKWIVMRNFADYGVLRKLKFMPVGTTPRVIVRVRTHVNDLVQKLGMSPRVANSAIKFFVAQYQSGKSFVGRKPEAIAAALVYIFGRLYNYDVTQRDVAQAARIKEANVRKTMKHLLNGAVIVVFI